MNTLALVEFFDANGKEIDGLVPVNKPARAEGHFERASLLQAKAFDHIDYVFFRRFTDADGYHLRSSQIAAYVVDNSREKLSEQDIADLHHKLWLHGSAPLIYVAWPTSVDILSCAREPDFWHNGAAKYTRAEQIQTAADVDRALKNRFSAHRLAEGTFWDDTSNQKLANDKAAHRSLIRAIVEAERDLKGTKYPIRRRLLILTVLIKYLEDRGVFPKGYFAKFHSRAERFRDILRSGSAEEFLKLLEALEAKFNGDVFALGDDSDKITVRELRRLASFVEANNIGGQLHFWELYSFEHIPIEVISQLYQHFVQGHGAVYTPPFLAALLLDQVMPYDLITGTEKVLDPACGSGVFLVGAFRRLVTHWRSNNSWKSPTVAVLKSILAQNIHGVEMEENAIDLTAFSLALAVCDALDPPVIWEQLKFDKLRGKNLRFGDFFDPSTAVSSKQQPWPNRFDVIVGNPPFASKLTDVAKIAVDSRSNLKPSVPDQQAAYYFLERSLELLSNMGQLCLIQPHGLIYNSGTTEYRKLLMSLARLDTILDFVSIRGLYEGADPKTIAWHSTQSASQSQRIEHITFRRTYTVNQHIGFELDHYDRHLVSRTAAQENASVWRENLLGGGRLHAIAERLKRLQSLKTYVDKQKREYGWDYGEGYTLGNREKHGPWLTGLRLLPTEAFTETGIDDSRIQEVLTETHFEAPRIRQRFDPPMLLIKKHGSLPMSLWSDGQLAYQNSILGITAPQDQQTELSAFCSTLERNRYLYQFYILTTGFRSLTCKATSILKRDVDCLPLPDNSEELQLSEWEKVLQDDVLNYMADFIRLGQNAALLKEIASNETLKSYSDLYVEMLGSLYDDLHPHSPIFLNGLIAQPFYFGSKPDVSWLEANCEHDLRDLVYDKSRASLRTIRVVRYYDENVILIVKPDRLRYWIRSTAIRDADDTLVDLQKQGWK